MKTVRFELNNAETAMLERVVKLTKYYGCSPKMLFVQLLKGALDAIDMEAQRDREARMMPVDEAVAERRYAIKLAMFPGDTK